MCFIDFLISRLDGLWSFQMGDTKLDFFQRINILKGNYWILDSCLAVKKSQNLTFKVNFLCQNCIQIFLFFFIEEYHFRSTFFVIDIFKSLYDDALFLTTRHQSKTQNSIISYWYDDSYLCKNRSNFYPPRERSATHIAKMWLLPTYVE